MNERKDAAVRPISDNSRTNRPENVADDGLSVSDVLQLPAAIAGDPEIICGGDRLDNRLRWLHIVEGNPKPASFVTGAELLLTTGLAWPTGAALNRYLDELLGTGPAALIIELGSQYQSVPKRLAEACERHRVPLIAFRRETQFVTLTQQVHQLIIERQTRALRHRDHVRKIFGKLQLAEVSVRQVVETAARELQAPVILEDANHHVVTAALGFARPSLVLDSWERHSRALHQSTVAPTQPYPVERDGWRLTPVAAHGRRWGALISMPNPHATSSALDDRAAAVVMREAAMCLAFQRLASPADSSWLRLSWKTLLRTLLDRDWDDAADTVALLDSAGFRVSRRKLVGVVIGASEQLDRRPQRYLDQLHQMVAALGVDLLARAGHVGSRSVVTCVMSMSPDTTARNVVQSVAKHLNEQWDGGVRGVGLGFLCWDVDSLVRSVYQASQVLERSVESGPVVVTATSGRLQHLAAAVADDPAVRVLVEELIGPVLAYDSRSHGDLLRVVESLVAYPTNRTLAATECGLSRSVYYQRIETLERLLGVDLSDGETLASLALAAAIVRQG